MSDPTAAFTIELKDETSASAKSAQQALKDLKESIDSDIKALREMQAAARNMKGQSSASEAQIKKLSDAITAQKSKIAAAQAKYIQLGGTFGKTEPKVVSLTSELKNLGGEMSKSGGIVGMLGGSLTKLSGLLANPVTLIAAITVALLAFVAAIGVTVAALGRYALAQSDARRSELLRLEGFRSLRTMFGRTMESAEGMQAAIDRASDSSGLGRGQLEGYAQSLARVGFRGEALAEALEGTAIAAQVQGERGAARFRALAMQAALTGRSVRDVAEAYRRRLGPIAQRIMMSLPNQAERLRMSLERIFSGLRIETFLSVLNQITSAFSQTTATGRALKFIVETIFQPLFDATGTLGPIVRMFFQGMIIGALLVTIMFLRVRNAIRDAFGDSEFLSNEQLMTGALYAGVAAVLIFVGAIMAAGAALALIGAFVGFFIGMILALPAAVIAVGLAVGAAVAAVVNFFQETDFRALAVELIDGLVSGLMEGVGRIRAAVTTLATTARDTFREVLGIHSPSREFMRLGVNIAQGVARGVDAGSGSAQSSVANMVEAEQGAAVNNQSSQSIGPIEIHIHGVNPNDADAIGNAIRDKIADLFEGALSEMGAT